MSEIRINGRTLRARTERKRVSNNRQRALRRGLRADLSLMDWALRLAQFDFSCAYCGRPFYTMDHVLPLGNGGGTTFVNVVPCCEECNSRKGAAVWLPAVAESNRTKLSGGI
ncbi:MAG: HNH endonuclease [Anaerolinea sp.]|nr:HNH endonuclease [Anaerolinea sp.]